MKIDEPYCPPECYNSSFNACLNPGKLCTCDGINHRTCPHHATQFRTLPDVVAVSASTYTALIDKVCNED